MCIRDSRITKGTGRYSDTFPVPVQEFGNQKPLVIGDQQYNSVSLSTHMNGAEGGQTFTDSGPISHTITAVGDVYTKQLVAGVAGSSVTVTDPNKDADWDNVVLLLNGEATDLSDVGNNPVGHTITTDSNFGSGYTADGAGGGVISTTDSITLDGDFTIEMWIKHTDHDIDTYYARAMSTEGAWNRGGNIELVYEDGVGVTNKVSVRSYAGSLSINGTIVTADGEWHHIQVNRASGVVSLWVDGVQSGSNSSDNTSFGNAKFFFGASGDGSGTQGRMEASFDDIRITKGSVRSTGLPTAALSAPSPVTETVTDANWSDVVFLLQSNDQDTSNSFYDTGGSATTHTVSQTNGVIHSTDFAKFGTCLLYTSPSPRDRG